MHRLLKRHGIRSDDFKPHCCLASQMHRFDGAMTDDFDLRKVTSPLLVHLIGQELPRPRLFLWRCKRTVGRLREQIDPRFPAELVDLVALPVWVYLQLKQRLGPEKAFEIMRVAILSGGLAKWNLQFDTVAVPRTFENMCEQELRMNQHGITRWNTIEVVERTAERFELKVTRCLYHELACSLGVPELTPVMCGIDNAANNSYLPDRVIFHRGGPGHRISDGAKECRFVWER